MNQKHKLQAVRCPSCGGKECGWDAYSAFNPVTQDTELGGEYDNGWCNDCGDVDPEFYEPVGDELAELQKKMAEYKARERLIAAAPDLREALADFIDLIPPALRELYLDPANMSRAAATFRKAVAALAKADEVGAILGRFGRP
jgi:hypothetical protein